MKGKNIDEEFVSTFIQSCIKDGKTSALEICEEAIIQIKEIDLLFNKRLKLNNVLDHFGFKKNKLEKEKVKSILIEIDNEIANEIFSLLENEGIEYNNFVSKISNLDNKDDYIFTFKQLLQNGKITKNQENILKISNDINK